MGFKSSALHSNLSEDLSALSGRGAVRALSRSDNDTDDRKETRQFVYEKSTHDDRVAAVRVRTRYCKWCGASIVSDEPAAHPYLPEYCNKQHAHQASKMRNKRRRRELLACPTPSKRRYYDRGDAIVWAAICNQFAYACQCHFFHLTSDPPRSSGFEPMNELVAARKAEYTALVANKKTAKVSVGDAATVDISYVLNAYASKHGETLQSQIDALWIAVHEIAATLADLKKPKPGPKPGQSSTKSVETEPAEEKKRRWWLWHGRDRKSDE